MKAEEQILELLAEVLRRQDKTQETLQETNNRLSNVKVRLGSVEVRLGSVEVRLGDVAENQVAHQQILRTLALGQQKHQRELEDILDILDSVARSAIPTAASTAWSIPATSPNSPIYFANSYL